MYLSEIYDPGITLFMVGKGRHKTEFRPFSGNLENEGLRDLDPITTLLTEEEKSDVLEESSRNLAYNWYIIDEATREDIAQMGVSEIPSCKSVVPWTTGTNYSVSKFSIELPYKLQPGKRPHIFNGWQ